VTVAAWYHCFSGIAGDMALGALVDAGADLNEVRALCERLPVSGWTLDAEPVVRAGLASTHVVVRCQETSVVRTHAHIAAMVEEARLPERVRKRALATFHALAVAEGKIHRRPPEQVHVHEVGALDAIVDIVGTVSALEVLDVDELYASAVANGTGMTRAAHGVLPIPAPAVVELLRGAPTYGLEVPHELTTPTGAALLAANAVGWGPLPSMEIGAIGFGAGTREIDGRPNVVQVVLGDRVGALPPGQPLLQLEVIVDDATGETLAHAVSALLDAGAHDAWIVPIVMKKGRPAYTVAVLCDPALAQQIADVLRHETGSLGVRGTTVERWPSARTTEEVEVAGFPVRVKVSAGRVKVEHDDAARIAKRTGLPLREVVSLAEESARRGHGLVSLPTNTDDNRGDDSA
jgi:uncharacterized protein (TIGR00299 family) protein